MEKYFSAKDAGLMALKLGDFNNWLGAPLVKNSESTQKDINSFRIRFVCAFIGWFFILVITSNIFDSFFLIILVWITTFVLYIGDGLASIRRFKDQDLPS